GGRVHPRLQKKGIGIELARHAIEHARSHGATRILYDTSTRNQGSQAIARHFGFKEIDRLRISVLSISEIKGKTSFNGQANQDATAIEQVEPSGAYSFLESIGFSDARFLCTGWAFIPFGSEQVDHLPWRWYKLGGTIALVLTNVKGALYEGPRENETWYVIYGESENARELTRQLVVMGKNDAMIERFSIFCPEALVPGVEELGFHPWESNPVWTVLFELDLRHHE
nr:GNAT family N-acetyltransferase [Candidatus Sigynarchaeota archaeon]